jgi:hypothetical protein
VGVGSLLHVLRTRPLFRRYRGRRVPCSCFARPNSFSAVPRASGPIFQFCAPILVFDSTEGVRSRFHVLRIHTRFRRYRGRRVQFSCSLLPDSFLALPWASGPVFLFFAPGLIFGGTGASDPVFMFCAPGLIFGGTVGLRSLFHVLRSRTCFRRFRGWVAFSCFPYPDLFSAVPRTSGPFSCFALPDSFLTVPRASGPFFIFCAPGLIFGGTEGVVSRYNVLCTRTRFRRYRGRRVPFSCFALPDSFSAVQWASDPIFLFCDPGLIFDGTVVVGSRFHVLRSRTRFRRYRGCHFSCSCFARLDSFSAVPGASLLVFLFCAPRLFFGGTEGVVSRFDVLCSRTCFWRCRVRRLPFSCSRTHFRRYRGHRVPFSCFALPDSFSALV